MFTQVAVVPFDPDEDFVLDELLPIAAAIQVQVQRDLGPHWGLQAAVSAFRTLEQVPPGTWPVAVTKRADLKVDGFHFVMNGLPFGIVGKTDDLSVVLSHEIAEMLVDASGQRAITGPAFRETGQAEPGDRIVDYVVEVCDACEGETYQINGVDVADFVVPGYYDMNHPRAHGYSFTGAVSAPRQVLSGGYITWRAQFPSNTFFQAFGFQGDMPETAQKYTDTPVLNPRAQGVTSKAEMPRVPEELQVLRLPRSPTRAWREVIAHIARQLDKTKSDAAVPTRGVEFADTFRANIAALLTAMRHPEPPPSIPQILDAIQDTEAAERVRKTPRPEAHGTQRDRIIRWLEQQERLAPGDEFNLDPELAMWMWMIMP